MYNYLLTLNHKYGDKRKESEFSDDIYNDQQFYAKYGKPQNKN